MRHCSETPRDQPRVNPSLAWPGASGLSAPFAAVREGSAGALGVKCVCLDQTRQPTPEKGIDFNFPFWKFQEDAHAGGSQQNPLRVTEGRVHTRHKRGVSPPRPQDCC